MTLRIRKRVVCILLGTVLSVAYLPALAGWLEHVGLVGVAQSIRDHFLTGTAFAVITMLLFLARGGPPQPTRRHVRRCGVCDQALSQGGRYCPACGSRV